MILQKMGRDIQGKPIGHLDLRRGIPAGVALDNTTIWSIWKSENSWYIVTCNIASSEIQRVELTGLDDYQLTMSPNGEYIAAYCNEVLDLRTHLIILNGRTGEKLAANSWESAPMATGEEITAVQFSADGEMLAVTYSGGQLRIFRRKQPH